MISVLLCSLLRDHSSAEKFINPTAVLDEEISSPLFVVGLALHMFAVDSVCGGVTMQRSWVIFTHQLIIVIHYLQCFVSLIIIRSY